MLSIFTHDFRAIAWNSSYMFVKTTKSLMTYFIHRMGCFPKQNILNSYMLLLISIPHPLMEKYEWRAGRKKKLLKMSNEYLGVGELIAIQNKKLPNEVVNSTK